MERQFFSKDTHIGAVHLNVNFMDNSVKFYHEILGMDIIEHTPSFSALGVNDSVLIYLYQTNHARVQTAGLFHFALLVPSRAALGNIFYHLIKTEYPLAGASNHDVSEAIYLQDPEGNGIEIYRDVPSNEWQFEPNGNIVMGTSEMDYAAVIEANHNRPFDGMPKDTIIGHMHLSVIDLNQSIAFYNELFGLDVMTRYGSQAAFMATAGYHHHLGLNTWQHQTERARLDYPGLRKFDLNIPNEEDLQHFLETLSEKGSTQPKDENSNIVYDPSGIGIRIMTKN
ncbi:glyoxalase [Macrococcoides caseolyticum]|uniref:VOC family protein n=1 Tax=Macrococcoides caseolyticum TaxID=69966 RepID=UPI000C3483EA|nr:VOC family protein [Macrococcus caseolyticus]PKE35988.1 glyoxalase [Macrococcus caseolyticus]PKE44539.1 glyoxalase [Macrococcus caseolyticus]PKE74268.1 glyoxalase [Macrococcus caseolyticus]STY74849.1 Catechol-2,3-dioxygenase [Macrococcus caseolyticus]